MFSRRRICLTLSGFLLGLVLVGGVVAGTWAPVNDPFLGSQWYLPATHTETTYDSSGKPTGSASYPGLDAFGAWKQTKGAGVTIAVIDAAVDPTHPDLVANLLPGVSFAHDTGTPLAHATEIAGIAAASADNGIGIAGVAPESKILSLAVTQGETIAGETVISAFHYACSRPFVRVIVFAWEIDRAPGTQPSAALQAWLTSLKREFATCPALIVFAAGNSGVDISKSPAYPAAIGTLPNTIVVAGVGRDNRFATWISNWGPQAPIAAPVEDIAMTKPGGTYSGGGVGTSFSAALTAGVAALDFAAYPSSTAAQVRRALIVGATPLEEPKVAAGAVSATGSLQALGNPDTTLPAAFRLAVRSAVPASITRSGDGYLLKLKKLKPMRITRHMTPTARARARAHNRLVARLAHKKVRVALSWQPSTDVELVGYKLALDGGISYLPTSARSVSFHLLRGSHHFQLVAFDFSDNETPASR